MDAFREYIKIRIVGLVQLLFILFIIIAVTSDKSFLFVLPIILVLIAIYGVFGYGYLTLTNKGRIVPTIPAMLTILFITTQLTKDLNNSPSNDFVTTMVIDVGLLIANLFIIYVLYFSNEKQFFSKN